MTKSQSLVVVAGCMVSVLICLAIIVIAHQGLKVLSGKNDSAKAAISVTTIHDSDAAATLLVA